MVTLLLEGFGELYEKRRQLFSQDDICNLLRLVKSFMICPISMDVIIHPSVIQKACILLLQKIVRNSA